LASSNADDIDVAGCPNKDVFGSSVVGLPKSDVLGCSADDVTAVELVEAWPNRPNEVLEAG
jgi:hypothetical protein